MTLPTFLIIGAARSGTTALHYRLMQHPDIYMCPVKETDFFAFEGALDDTSHAFGFPLPGDQATFRSAATPDSGKVFDLPTYAALFNDVAGEKAIGEVSPTYLYSPYAPARIQHHLPDVRLIALLRHPVDRAYSGFIKRIRVNHQKLRPADFERVLDAEARSVRNGQGGEYHYLRCGLYYQQLKRYYDRFPANRIRLFTFDAFSARPAAVYREILRFLEIDDRFTPEMTMRINASGIPRSPALDRLLQGPRWIKGVLKTALPMPAVNALARMQSFARNRNLKTTTLDETVRQRLTETYYRDDILKLQDLTGLNLQSWIEPRPIGTR